MSWTSSETHTHTHTRTHTRRYTHTHTHTLKDFIHMMTLTKVGEEGVQESVSLRQLASSDAYSLHGMVVVAVISEIALRSHQCLAECAVSHGQVYRLTVVHHLCCLQQVLTTSQSNLFDETRLLRSTKQLRKSSLGRGKEWRGPWRGCG